MTQTLHLSKIIITNDSEPIIGGAFLVENSRIIKIGKKEDFGFLQNSNIKIIDHGESLICPGFINLHTHLLYSNLNQIDGSEGLFPWLGKLVDSTSGWNEFDYKNSIKNGIRQLLSSGTTFVVENSPNSLSTKELSDSPLKALIGLEVFGSDEEKADEMFSQSLEKMSKCHSQLDWESSTGAQFLDSRFHGNDTKRIDFTFSPHAPYDVSVPLWRKLIQWADENGKPLLTHLEESPQEKLWWQEKSGPAVDFWQKINKLEPKLKYWKKYKSGIDFLYRNNLLNGNIIATHLCQADEEDLNKLRELNIKLVHCPRSNFYLNNGNADLKLWSELDFLWGMGTDSSASNLSLDLLEEIRFTLNLESIISDFTISAKDAFQSITSTAAKIINKDSEIGYLKAGYTGDFLIYDIKDKSGCTYQDPYHLLIWDTDNNKDLKEVWISGEKVFIAEPILNKLTS